MSQEPETDRLKDFAVPRNAHPPLYGLAASIIRMQFRAGGHEGSASCPASAMRLLRFRLHSIIG